MSLLSTIAPLQAATAGHHLARALPSPTPIRAGDGERPPQHDATAEMTQTGSRLPPVTATRRTNAGTDARDGGQGRATPEVDDARTARENARAAEEALQREAVRREMLEQIPVPVDALPKLGGDLEMMRAIRDSRATPSFDTRA